MMNLPHVPEPAQTASTTIPMASAMLQKYSLYSSVVSTSSKKSMSVVLSTPTVYHFFRDLKIDFREAVVFFEDISPKPSANYPDAASIREALSAKRQ